MHYIRIKNIICNPAEKNIFIYASLFSENRYESTDLDSTDKIYGNKTKQMLEEKLGDNDYSRK